MAAFTPKISDEIEPLHGRRKKTDTLLFATCKTV
jgi:hypothetical protein